MNIQMIFIKTEEQIADLCKIAERVWHLTYDPFLPDGQVEYMLEKFQSPHAVREQMETMNYRYYMAVVDGANAGFIGFSPRYEGREEMFLSKVYLLPEFRGQGAVREMFRLVEAETHREKLSKIRLTVNRENTHAVEVYGHYGFRIAEKAVTDIGNGYVMDDYIMVKELQ